MDNDMSKENKQYVMILKKEEMANVLNPLLDI